MMRRLLPLLAVLPIAAAACVIAGPTDDGLDAQAFAEKLGAAQTANIPDECGYILDTTRKPTNAKEWVSKNFVASAVVRGDVLAVSTGPSPDTAQLVLRLTSVNGNVAAAVGDEVHAILPKYRDPSELAGITFKPGIEAIFPVGGPAFGEYLNPNDPCDPVIIGDDLTATLVAGWSDTTLQDGKAWNSGTMDELEQSAVNGLG